MTYIYIIERAMLAGMAHSAAMRRAWQRRASAAFGDARDTYYSTCIYNALYMMIQYSIKREDPETRAALHR